MTTSTPLLQVKEMPLEGVLVLTPKRFVDDRGWFCETWNSQRFEDIGLNSLKFVQDNQSFSGRIGTLRGLHFQTPPFAQDKLVRVLKGKILDIVVDLRSSSATYGQHCSVELSADIGEQLFIPKGFAHGFVTLTQDVEVFYKVTAPYSFEHDKGLLYNDLDLKIDWRFPEESLYLSEKDKQHPCLKDLPKWFE